ncbi:MAG: GNAT family N-acetyltransferase [Bacilli bacterium]|jgi:GNAT superfamily N-acetyltransferase
MITIKRLTLDMFPDYVKLHESVSFEHAPQWQGCYCLYYHSKLSYPEWVTMTKDDKKGLLKKTFEDGLLTGFLAYDGARPVGWLNVNDMGAYVRLAPLLEPYKESGKVALSICFLIEKDYRGQGLARRLLDEAIDYYRHQGYESMLSLPTPGEAVGPQRYRGTYNMYIERGYREISPGDQTLVMRLSLK